MREWLKLMLEEIRRREAEALQDRPGRPPAAEPREPPDRGDRDSGARRKEKGDAG